jgi:hypothetical protein
LDIHVQLLNTQNTDLGNRINLVKQDAEINNNNKLNTIRNLEDKSNILTQERFAVEVDLKTKCEELHRNLEKVLNENRSIKLDSDTVSN